MEQCNDPFFEIRCPSDNMQRDASTPDVIYDTIIPEHVRAGIREGAGIGPLRRLLFWGPRGCGKDLAAQAIANELDLYLVTLSLDEPLGPLLIHALLHTLDPRVTGAPVVVLVKGLDTTLADNSGAAQRVANTVLNWMESGAGGNIAIITATNCKDVERVKPRAHIDASIYFGKPQMGETP